MIKKTIFFFLLFCLYSNSIAFSNDSDDWTSTPQDELRAFKNDNSPPIRTMPKTMLSPLSKEMEGTVRSVQISEQAKIVALTFDMCELARSTSGCNMEIVNFLRQEKIPATFFMGGKWMRTHKERVKQIMFNPLFEIGNHAWTHGNFGIMNRKQMEEQVFYTQAQYELLREEAIQEKKALNLEFELSYIPPDVPKFFRFPYGRCNDEALRFIVQCGLQAIQWSVVGEIGSDNGTEKVAERVFKSIKPGDIILLHANKVPKNTEILVKNLVRKLRDAEYSFVTVSELLKMGKAKRTREGYFFTPGDALEYDKKFGKYGTGE